MKVFLSGATGFIGSHTLKTLLERGYFVRISIRKNSVCENIKGFLESCDVMEGDLSDLDFALKCVRGCDAVIHTAGKVLPSIQENVRSDVIRSNYTTTHNIFAACEKEKIDRIVFLGSIFGLGKGNGKNPADENVQFNLRRLEEKIPYVKAKRMAEVLADRFVKRGVPIIRVYPNFCLGEGDIYLSSSKAILPFVAGMDLFFDMGLNIQWVGDAAKSLVLALERGKDGEKYISGGDNIMFEEVGKIVAKIMGRKPPGKKINPTIFKFLFFLPDKILRKLDAWMARRIKIIDVGMLLISSERYWFYSDKRAREELGYTSQPLEETLKEAINWLRTRRRPNKSKVK